MNNIKKLKYCLIYCRVSSKRQVEEGNGLSSQEKRCRNFAKVNNYTVEEVFEEKGVSGALFDRPAMDNLIQHIDDNPHKQYAVIFDDLKRFARDYDVHKRLKLELVVARQVKLECLNFNFENTPESEFIEGILALHGELERKQNKRQVIQKMKARLERGYWPFYPPVALINKSSSQHGKILVFREPLSIVFKEAIEGYAYNILNSQHEVREFIKQRYKEMGVERSISIHGVQRILRNPLYAGLIEYSKWDISLMKAQHEGFITEKVFNIVQDKLSGKTKPKSGKTFSADFPLRRFITCDVCGSKLRASWNKGNGGKYPNYWCQFKGECRYKYKVTRANTLHKQFENVLKSIKLSGSSTALAKTVFDEVWVNKKVEWREAYKDSSYKKREIDKKISVFADKVATASSEALIKVYENKIEVLSDDLKSLKKNFSIKKKFDKNSFDGNWNRVEKQLENPLLLWNSPNLEDKRTVLHMYFNKGLSWDYKNGFGTIEIADEINLIRNPVNAKLPDVEMGGNEPPSVNSHFY